MSSDAPTSPMPHQTTCSLRSRTAYNREQLLCIGAAILPECACAYKKLRVIAALMLTLQLSIPVLLCWQPVKPIEFHPSVCSALVLLATLQRTCYFCLDISDSPLLQIARTNIVELLHLTGTSTLVSCGWSHGWPVGANLGSPLGSNTFTRFVPGVPYISKQVTRWLTCPAWPLQ